MAWKKNAGGQPDSRLKGHFVSPAPGRVLLLSPVLVALTTWLLFMLQSVLWRLEGRQPRPFDIGYLIPILFLTVLGGRAVGVLTLLLSAGASVYVLSVPFLSVHVLHARDRTELLLLMLVGGTVVAVAGLFHTLLRELGEALTSAEMEIRVREAAEVEGVGRIRSCAVRRRGLDYRVSLEVGACPGLAAPAAQLLPGRVEAAVRRLDPLISQVAVTVTS